MALVVATVSAANDVAFESPIMFSMIKQGAILSLTFKTKLCEGEKIRKREAFIKIPKIESKLAYLSSLCSQSEIKSSVKIIADSVIFEYQIKEAISQAPRLYASDDEQSTVFYELLEAFNPPSSFDDELDEKTEF